HHDQRRPDTLARAQSRRSLDMLDREIVFAGNVPDDAAHIPAASEARVERQRTVDQPYHGTDILADIVAEMRQHEHGVGEDAWIILSNLERLSGKITPFAAVCLRRFRPSGSGDL